MSAVPEPRPHLKPKRFVYRNDLRWSGEKRGQLRAEDRPPLELATPVEFKGHPGIWTPEDLFVASANACLMTTFLALAARQDLAVHSFDCAAEGVVEFRDGGLRFTSIILRPTIIVDPDRVDDASALIEKAERACLVSASIETPIELDPIVEAG